MHDSARSGFRGFLPHAKLSVRVDVYDAHAAYYSSQVCLEGSTKICCYLDWCIYPLPLLQIYLLNCPAHILPPFLSLSHPQQSTNRTLILDQNQPSLSSTSAPTAQHLHTYSSTPVEQKIHTQWRSPQGKQTQPFPVSSAHRPFRIV